MLDMSMSQFSYGRMETARHRGERLPVAGGYDKDGRLTDDPGTILESGRPLPIGFWKGAGLSLLLDLCAALISGGSTTASIGREATETSLSQVFIAFDLQKAISVPARNSVVSAVLDWTSSSAPSEGNTNSEIGFPGLRALHARRDSLANGVPLDESIWHEILALDV